MSVEQTLCPSSRCQPGAILLGVILPDGRVAFARDRIVIDEQFAEAAQEGRAPEKRFRFSSPCVRSACRQWTGSRCGVIDAVVDHLNPAVDQTDLPECSIRPQCRWFHQSGSRACAVCPLVVTDAREDYDDHDDDRAVEHEPAARSMSGATSPNGVFS